MRTLERLRPTFALLLALGACAPAADRLVAPYPDDECSNCAEWNVPQRPFRIFGNTYYVGTRGLGSILITSDTGHVLIDGGLPNSAPSILESVAELGFEPSDIRLLLLSHAHFDHAGGIAAIQSATGAAVRASHASARVLEAGRSGPDDPQYGVLLDFPALPSVHPLPDGDTVRLGPLVLTAHSTPAHAPGGTTWAWESCDGERCLDMVYADSQTPVSAEGFRYTGYADGRSPLAAFERGFRLLERVPCDILITPHPAASFFWERLQGGAEGLVDPAACRAYAASARHLLDRRLQEEAGSRADS